MNPYSEHAAGLVELQNELDDCPAIVWQGRTIKVLPGSVSLRSANSAGGMSLDSDFACSCLSSDFASQPASNQVFTYNGKRLKIATVRVAAGGKQYRIEANDAAQSL